MSTESFEIDVGELGNESQWRPLPRVIHGRQELRRVVNNIMELMLDSPNTPDVHANVIYLRVRRTSSKKLDNNDVGLGIDHA
jgi:hypothetical protein